MTKENFISQYPNLASLLINIKGIYTRILKNKKYLVFLFHGRQPTIHNFVHLLDYNDTIKNNIIEYVKISIDI